VFIILIVTINSASECEGMIFVAKEKNPKQYDLENRTYCFAKDVRLLIKKIDKNLANVEDARQLIRSSGSVGANYIEANESLGKKDFALRIKISRKEAKESCYWLRLLDISEDRIDEQRKKLVQEATELMKIFGSILNKTL
jgi:four helix bundle protein